uniref:hypothetical protein n=1 Tax=Aquimarina sp. I32.4 TaxID=2053903 RepID=UPI001304B1C7
ETTIYQWSSSLFDEGKSIEEAVKIIQDRTSKILYSSGGPSNDKDVLSIKNHQKVINKLKLQSTYLNLNEVDKEKVLDRVDALIKTRLYSVSEIITLVLGIICHITMNPQTETNKNKTPPNDDTPMFFSEHRRYIEPKYKRMCI